MRIKPGVRFHSPGDAMMIATLVVRDVCQFYDVECVVTGGIEQHEPPSKHVTGGGLDFRTRQLTTHIDRQDFAHLVKNKLGDAFDVVLEKDHLHVEYDPKT